tara:strand:- start:1465 stop:1935 length:471 start_codon:yes stop_codon:yes gene_type:complete
MFSTSIIIKLVLVFSFNFLEASDNDITTVINDIDLKIDKIKNKYFLIRRDIFSPGNSVSTNFDSYSDSLKAISSKLRASRDEIFKKIIGQDIEKNYLIKISKIKFESELLINSISVLLYINDHYNTKRKNTLITFGDYESQIKRLIKFEKHFYEIK